MINSEKKYTLLYIVCAFLHKKGDEKVKVKKIFKRVELTENAKIKEYLKQIDLFFEEKYEFTKIVSIFEEWGYEIIKYKSSKVIMHEPFNNITIHLFFKYDLNNKRVFSGLRM